MPEGEKILLKYFFSIKWLSTNPLYYSGNQVHMVLAESAPFQ